MRNLNCKNCGGIMIYDVSSMTAHCRFCGTSYVLDHKDTDYFRTFYKQMVDSSGKSEERKSRDDSLWENADKISFTTNDGQVIEIRYLHSYTDKCADVYVARNKDEFLKFMCEYDYKNLFIKIKELRHTYYEKMERAQKSHMMASDLVEPYLKY